jgi:hypothetical protein
MPYSVPAINRLQLGKLTRQEPDTNPNAHLRFNERTGSLLAYRVIRARLRERDIRQRDIGEWDVGERDIQERPIRVTIDSCQFAK